jgi:hypothetical protein
VPILLGSRFARRFEFRSECEFISDTEWVVRDTTRFEDGRIDTREMRARLVAPDRVQTTGDDMPSGAEVQLHERGFTFRPYLLALRAGRLRLRVRCRDRCWLDGDDVLHDEIRMSWLRLPLGKVTMRLRHERSVG